MSATKMTYCVFILLSLVVILFAAFVWPTAYRYFPMSSSEIKTTARINRFTGHAEVLTLTGWVSLGAKPDIFDVAADKMQNDVVPDYDMPKRTTVQKPMSSANPRTDKTKK